MSREELKRVRVLERISSGIMTCAEATESLGISSRQLRRLKTKYKADGAEGLIHGNRGRKPKHALREDVKEEILRLFEERYYDTNFCHFSNLLERRENIFVSPSSVERILKLSGRKAKHPQKRRAKKHHPRERRSLAGMLWQIDATPYEWLGSGFGRFALHAAIDDATNIVTGAYFMQNECMEGHSETMRRGIERYGVPAALYSDRHTIFSSQNEKLSIDEELDGVDIPLSNFGKAMAELSIVHIKAATPQAKGRIERLWKTFQDRLPVELRLAGASNIEEANAVLAGFLDYYNAHFSVQAAESVNAYLSLEKSVNLDYLFSKRQTRKVGSGSEVIYKHNIYVPCVGEPCPATRTTVEVRETFAGEVIMWYKGRAVKLRKIESAKRPVAGNTEAASLKPATAQTLYIPDQNHPWRRGYAEKLQGTAKGGGAVV